jgi:DNA-binding response OmpR family regulator
VSKEQAQASTPSVIGGPTPPRIILLVASDDATREPVAAALWRAGFSVVVTENADTAKQRLEDGVEPSLIIIDVTMPDQGWPVWDLRQASLPDVPVLLLTDAFSSARVGDAVALSKPLDADVVRATVESLVPRRP